jgi:nucleoid-associated protein YgaU
MKSGLFYTIISLLVVSLLAGCAPQLAQTKYGPEETQWKDYISKSYHQWEPPATPPPLSSGKSNMPAESSSIEIVPEASADMDGMTGAEFPSIEPMDNHETVAFPEKGVDNDIVMPALEKDTTYTVKKGDTLWTISKQFYNNGKNWKKIQEANKDILPTPEKLKAGMNLKIPAN